MAKRDVELVIKARDQAKAAIESITDALLGLRNAQQGVGESAASANGLLGRLTTELADLQRTATGLQSLGRVATQMDRMAQSATRLERASRESGVRMGEMSEKAAKAARDLTAAQTASNRQAAALDQQKRALAALVELQERQARAVAAGRRFAPQSPGLNLDIARLEQTQAKVRATQQAVSAAAVEFRRLDADVSRAQTALTRANREFDTAARSALNDARALEQVNQEMAEVRGRADAMASELGAVDSSQEAVAQSARETAAAMGQVTAAIQRQQQAVRAGTGGAAGGAAAQATAQFRAQQEAVRQTQAAWAAAREEANRLGREIANTAQPTAALRGQFVAAQAASKEAAAAYNEQIAALARLRGEVRAGIAARQQEAETNRLAAVALAERGESAARLAQQEQAARVAAALLGRDTQVLANGLRQVSVNGIQAANGIRQFGDQSRRALSLAQRLRGEVLSLATGYLGLYAAITNIGGVIGALRAVEAAQSRLNVAFGGDQAQVRQELRFISQEADRLGLSFRVLAQEYGRFAIAADAANFSTENTRRIFQAVAVAARVNKVTTEELEGTYLALQQMISKGTVSMEELRRQLGDRLPGAFNIFADALGVSTAELNDMIRRGEVLANEENLTRFAEELEERFGGQLPAALSTTTAELDRFSNNIFEAQQRIAAGGFSEALRESLQELNELFRSREGRDFFLQLGAALGVMVRVLSVIVQNLDLLILGFRAFIALKAAQFFSNLVLQMRASAVAAAELTAAQTGLTAAQIRGQIVEQSTVAGRVALLATLRALLVATGQYTAAVIANGVASNAAAAAGVRLAAAAGAVAVGIRTVLASLGPIGIALIALSTLAALFIDFEGAVDNSAQALDEHNRQMDLFAAEAQRATAEQREFNAALVDVSTIEARSNLDALANSFADLRKEASDSADEIIDSFRRRNAALANDPMVRQLRDLTNRLEQGRITVFEYQQQLTEMFDATENDAMESLLGQLIGVTRGAREAEVAMAEQAVVTDRLGDRIDNLDGLVNRMGLTYDAATGSVRSMTDALGEQARLAEQAQEALGRVEDRIPALARARERSGARDQLEADIAASLEGVTDSQELERRRQLGEQARAELERGFREEDQREASRGRRSRSRRDDQREFNEDLQRSIELRRFEIGLIGQSVRQQEIERAVFEARQRASERGVQISREQEQAIRDSVGASFDAEQAERLRLQTLQEQIQLRELLGQTVSVQQQIEEEALQAGIDLTAEYAQGWAEARRQIIETERAQESLRDQVEEVVALERQRQEAIREFEAARGAGELNRAQQAEQLANIERMRVQIELARDAALELARRLGDEEAIARLERLNSELSETEQRLRETATSINNMFAEGVTDAIISATDEIGKAIDGTQSWGEALQNIGDIFRQFAADFLRQIARMIIQALILRAIQSTGFGGLVASAIPTNHGGGMAGSGPKRNVNPMWFANAMRYHTGGIAGLKADEVPSILKRGEEVLTENDPRHRANGGPPGSVKVVNVFDPGEAMEQALSSAPGERALLNYVRENKDAFNAALQG